jgi:hypothetical protein
LLVVQLGLVASINHPMVRPLDIRFVNPTPLYNYSDTTH